MPRGARQAWLGALVAVLVLVGCELALRAGLVTLIATGVVSAPPTERRFEAIRRLIIGYERWWRAAANPLPPQWTHDARRGHKTTPGLEGSQAPGGYTVSSDALGARGRRGAPETRRAGTTRVITLGDSYTFGQGVDDGQTWPALLARLRPDLDVVNLGASCYAQDQMLLALEDTAPAYRPDVVVLGFASCDLERNLTTFYCAEKPAFVRDASGYHLTNVPVPAWSQLSTEMLWRPLLVALPPALLQALGVGTPPPVDPAPLASYLLERMRAESERQGARFVVVDLTLRDEPPRDAATALPQAYCRGAGVPCVETRAAFGRVEQELGPQAYASTCFLADGHYAEAGHRLVAEALAAALPPPPASAPAAPTVP